MTIDKLIRRVYNIFKYILSRLHARTEISTFSTQGGKTMKQRDENMIVIQGAEYSSPVITVMSIVRDVITESSGSHNDSNMGEWDTEV